MSAFKCARCGEPAFGIISVWRKRRKQFAHHSACTGCITEHDRELLEAFRRWKASGPRAQKRAPRKQVEK